jgi:hypothetical protein
MDEPIAISLVDTRERAPGSQTLSRVLSPPLKKEFEEDRANPKGVYWRECPKKH